MKIRETPIDKNQYYPVVEVKNQIVLHHTVSNPESAVGDMDSWKSDTARIATYAIIGIDGTINKCFPSNQWAHHLGVKEADLKKMKFEDFAERNLLLNKHSIGIELDCWGGLTEKDGVYFNAYGKPISSTLEVVKCNWRGYKRFQRYSFAQIQALAELLPILMKANNIPNVGLKDGNFDVSKDALSGVAGVYSHSNFRADKSDLFPDERIVKLLNNLNV